jgi:uncharacterized protein (DUF1501 family)
MNRRHFLQRSAGLVALGAAPPAFLSRAIAADKQDSDQRILVIVQLAGGNDGVNTVIPWADDAYHKARPSLAFKKDAVLKIDDHLGLHPQMSGLKSLYDEGVLSILQGVGYPQPNRSHFRSMDIWNTAHPEAEMTGDGWLGRALDSSAAKFAGKVPALALGMDNLPLALVAPRTNVPSIRSLDDYQLRFSGGDEKLKQAQARKLAEGKERSGEAASEPTSNDLSFIRQSLGTAIDSAARLKEVAASYQPAADYPKTQLAANLKTVAQLIAGELGTRIFFVSLGGFDTHSRQAGSHSALLAELSGAVAAFFKDLRGHKLADRVMLATYSEFGRRLKENGSLGTDHGAASQMFVVSDAHKGGIIGAHPSLTDLDDGDPKHHTDFRSVYATLLDRWLHIPSEPVLAGKFAPLGFLPA